MPAVLTGNGGAPPPASAFSRRVQYVLFAGYVIAIVGIMFAIALLLVSRLDPRSFSTLRGIVVDAGALFTGAGRAGVRSGDDALDTLDDYSRRGQPE